MKKEVIVTRLEYMLRIAKESGNCPALRGQVDYLAEELKEKIEINVYNVGVDAGMIMICDENYYNDFGKKIDYGRNPYNRILSQRFDVKPGVYSIKWSIENTWNGHISGEGIVETKSGRLTVSDPCYCIENWDKWLRETEFGKRLPDNVILIDKMGGDGVYDVDLKLEMKKAFENLTQ